MQFYGKTDSNNYLTDISTNPQNGFSEFSVLDKYAPFLPQYFSKIWIQNGIAQVPNNLPITQFEQEKADWDKQLKEQTNTLNDLSTSVDNKIAQLQSKADEANKSIDQKMQASTLMMMNFQNSIAKEIASAKTTTEQAPQTSTLNSEVQSDSNNANSQK